MKRTICTLSVSLLPFLCSASSELGLKTVVIDPGHGGHDPGCVSRDKKTYEKTFALDISKKLCTRIGEACPDVKVLMTRSEDKYLTLNDRAEFANRAGADLFISIHINAVPSTGPSGSSVHVLGQSHNKDTDLFASNMDICKRENSVIMMEDNYTAKYQGFDPEDPESYIFMQLMQDSHLEQSLNFAQLCSQHLKGGPIKSSKGVFQDPFYVLWKTSMPAVLVEIGFMSNPSDLETLKSSANRDKIAERLCQAFIKFKKTYDQSVKLQPEKKESATAAKPAAKETAAPEKPASGKSGTAADSQPKENGASANSPTAAKPSAGQKYGVQIFCLKTKIPENDRRLLGYKPTIVPKGELFKYVIAVSDDIESVRNNLKEIRRTYPDAFVVAL